MAQTDRMAPDREVELRRYPKPGARVVLYANRLEVTTGILWNKRTHTIPLRAITSVSVQGLGGNLLMIGTAGGVIRVAVGVGAAENLRRAIVEALPK